MKSLLIISAIYAIIVTSIVILIDAALAWLAWLAFNAWTQLHPDYDIVFAIVIIISMLTGGVRVFISIK